MKKIILISANIILVIFLYFLNIWYEDEDVKIRQINKSYTENIRKLDKLAKINRWISENVKQNFIPFPDSAQNADLKLISFFDTYATKYSFQVQKFIYKDKYAHFLNIKYTLPRSNYTKLVQFMKQKYKSGYKMLQSFNVDKDTLQGELIIIQPYLLEEKKKKKGKK